jgi:hypothetical protein
MLSYLRPQNRHVNGNNFLVNKFKRVNVPLISETNPTNVVQGRYFFPEDRQLNKAQIKGVQLHYGQIDISLKANVNIPGGYLLWFVNPSIFNGLNGFITMYDQDGNSLFDQTPAAQWYNGGFGKIIPINAKIDFVKSYIYVPEPYASTPPIVPAFTMTFFYD